MSSLSVNFGATLSEVVLAASSESFLSGAWNGVESSAGHTPNVEDELVLSDGTQASGATLQWGGAEAAGTSPDPRPV